MKRTYKLISTLLVSTALFAGFFTSCEMALKNTLPVGTKEASSESNTDSEFTEVSFSLFGAGISFRTACPVYEWDNYTYELYIKTPGANESKLVVEKSPFARFMNTMRLPKVTVAPYQFTLKGYANLNGTSTQVLEGNTGDVLLNTDAKELSFIMYPTEGSTGSTRIVVTFPEDGTITSVKAAVASDRAGTSAVKENLEVTQGKNEKVCIYEKSDLQSAVKQYAVFWFYDSQEKLVYTTAESLQILGGKRSDSRIDITREFYNRREVTVTLNINGTAWDRTNVTVIVKDSEGKTYPLTSNNDGSFSGNIAPGEYEVIVIPNGSLEEIITGTIIDTESNDADALDKTVEFKTVNVQNNSVDVKPESGVAGTDPSGNLIVPDGNDFTVTVETKPGYKPADATAATPSTGTIEIGGKEVTVTQNDSDENYKGTISFNTATDTSILTNGIKSEDSKLEKIKYTITYNVNGGSFVSGYTEPNEFDVETCTAVLLPTNANITLSGSTLSGWKINGSAEIYTAIPAGTTENLTLEAVWMGNGSANYTIEIWKEKANSTDASVRDNNEITTRTENGTAETRTAVTAETLEGFNTPVITQATIASDGSSVVTVKYTRKNITLTLKADGGNWNGDTADKTISGKYGAMVSNTDGNPVKEDYAFAGWNTTGGTLPENFPSSDTIYTATWNQTAANFTVKFFFEDTDGDFKQNTGTYPDKTYKGTIGDTATAQNPPDAPEGFTRAIETAKITADGSAVVNVKYSRNQVTLNFVLEDTTGGKWSDETTAAKTITGKYGCTVSGTPVPTPAEDYSFAGWTLEGVSAPIPATFPLTGQTYTARWNLEKISYTIQYTKDDAEWTDHSYPVSGKGDVGSTTSVTVPVTIPGYTGSVTNITLGTDAAQNIVKVEYVRKTIKYTFDPNGGSWSESSENQEKSGKYNTAVTKPGDPANEGMVFGGWADESGNELGTYFGPEDKTYYAVWKSYIAGSGVNTFGNVTINKTDENKLQPVVPYDDTWTFVWYDELAHSKLGTGAEITVTGKGKHSVTLLATDSHGTEYTAAIEIEIN